MTTAEQGLQQSVTRWRGGFFALALLNAVNVGLGIHTTRQARALTNHAIETTEKWMALFERCVMEHSDAAYTDDVIVHADGTMEGKPIRDRPKVGDVVVDADGHASAWDGTHWKPQEARAGDRP